MSYYEQKRHFYMELQTIIDSNKGRTVPLSTLDLKYGLKYGFSKNTILKRLRMYEGLGLVEIDGDDIRIKGE